MVVCLRWRRGRLPYLKLPHSAALFYVIYSALFCIVHTDQACPIIQYNREQLLHIRLMMENTFPRNQQTKGNAHGDVNLLYLEHGGDEGNEGRGPAS